MHPAGKDILQFKINIMKYRMKNWSIPQTPISASLLVILKLNNNVLLFICCSFTKFDHETQ